MFGAKEKARSDKIRKKETLFLFHFFLFLHVELAKRASDKSIIFINTIISSPFSCCQARTNGLKGRRGDMTNRRQRGRRTLSPCPGLQQKHAEDKREKERDGVTNSLSF